jgi:hypothetical protein
MTKSNRIQITGGALDVDGDAFLNSVLTPSEVAHAALTTVLTDVGS